MVSSLMLSYEDVAKNPEVARLKPFSNSRNLMGLRVLWEGHEKRRNPRSALFRLCDDREGKLHYFRFDKRTNEWRSIDGFKVPQPFYRKREDVPAGTVRIEVFENGRMTRIEGK